MIPERMGGESLYRGPVTVAELTVAGRPIRVVRPAEPDRLLDEPGVLARNGADDYMPYWAYLWPGAFLLAEAVGREDWRPGLEAMEIGCGLGLAGLVGIAAGLRVQFTDYDPEPLGYVARSVAENGFDPGSFSTNPLDWRSPPDQTFPLILGADVLYERKLVPLVVGLIARMLAPGGVALVAGPYRVATLDLEGTLAPVGLTAEARPIEARMESGEAVRGTVHRIRWGCDSSEGSRPGR